MKQPKNLVFDFIDKIIVIFTVLLFCKLYKK